MALHTSWDEVLRGGWCKPLGHCDAARFGNRFSGPSFSLDGFVAEHAFTSASRGDAALVLEHRAELESSGGTLAGRHCAREHAAVPAVHEFFVHSVASRIAVRGDEAPAVVQGVEWAHLEDNLIQNGDEVDRIRGRARGKLRATGVRHVRLVVGRVEVYTVPTAREENFSSEAVWGQTKGTTCEAGFQVRVTN